MKKENILLIDDDDSLRKVIAHHLTSDGYRVISASGGKEGIELFKRGEFDLVITDLKMPDMDGMEVLREIKLLRDDVVVIMITAYGTIEKAVEALKAGAFDYITKPLNRDELKITIGKALQVKRLEEEGRITRTMAILAPAHGIVTEKMINEGQKIEAGVMLFKIIDHSQVWVYGEVYEY